MDDRMITVEVKGFGTLQGLGSGNPTPVESYDGNACRSYQGRAQAVVRSCRDKGEVCVTIRAEGYEPATVYLLVI